MVGKEAMFTASFTPRSFTDGTDPPSGELALTPVLGFAEG
jgi:hypothetical protein